MMRGRRSRSLDAPRERDSITALDALLARRAMRPASAVVETPSKLGIKSAMPTIPPITAARVAPTPQPRQAGMGATTRNIVMRQRGAPAAPPLLVTQRRQLPPSSFSVATMDRSPQASPPKAGQGRIGSSGDGSPPPSVRGTTSSDLASLPTPELTARLQTELNLLLARAREDAPQHLHSLRQAGGLAAEVIARWRRSTSIALEAINTLEGELRRRSDAVREGGARIADKDAALAAVEEELQTARAGARGLELQLRQLAQTASAVLAAAAVSAESGLRLMCAQCGIDGGATAFPPHFLASLRELHATASSASEFLSQQSGSRMLFDGISRNSERLSSAQAVAGSSISAHVKTVNSAAAAGGFAGSAQSPQVSLSELRNAVLDGTASDKLAEFFARLGPVAAPSSPPVEPPAAVIASVPVATRPRSSNIATGAIHSTAATAAHVAGPNLLPAAIPVVSRSSTSSSDRIAVNSGSSGASPTTRDPSPVLPSPSASASSAFARRLPAATTSSSIVPSSAAAAMSTRPAVPAPVTTSKNVSSNNAAPTTLSSLTVGGAALRFGIRAALASALPLTEAAAEPQTSQHQQQVAAQVDVATLSSESGVKASPLEEATAAKQQPQRKSVTAAQTVSSVSKRQQGLLSSSVKRSTLALTSTRGRSSSVPVAAVAAGAAARLVGGIASASATAAGLTSPHRRGARGSTAVIASPQPAGAATTLVGAIKTPPPTSATLVSTVKSQHHQHQLTSSSSSSALSASQSLPLSPPCEKNHGCDGYEATLQRALAFAHLEGVASSSSSSSSSSTTSAASFSATTSTLASSSSSSHAAASTTSAAANMTRTTLEIDIDPSLYGRATIGQLKAALATKAGRGKGTVIAAVYLSGTDVALNDDRATLTSAGVPVKASLDVVFAAASDPGITSTATASSITSKPSPPPRPSAPSPPRMLRTLQPLAPPAPPSPPQKQLRHKAPLPLPQPHGPPAGPLSAPPPPLAPQAPLPKASETEQPAAGPNDDRHREAESMVEDAAAGQTANVEAAAPVPEPTGVKVESAEVAVVSSDGAIEGAASSETPAAADEQAPQDSGLSQGLEAGAFGSAAASHN